MSPDQARDTSQLVMTFYQLKVVTPHLLINTTIYVGLLQESQQWPTSPPRTAHKGPSDPSAWSPGPHLNWQQQQQQLRQQQMLQQQQEQQQQQGQQRVSKEEFDNMLAQLTPQQQQALSKMPHQKRMDFFTNLRHQMLMAKRCEHNESPAMCCTSMNGSAFRQHVQPHLPQLAPSPM